MRQTLPIHRFFTTILFLAVTTLTWAYDFAVDGIYYDKNSNSTSVTVTYKTSSDRGYSGSVVIPSTVTYGGKTYSVTSIGSEAFSDCSGLTSVTIPNSVTSIGSDAFYNCNGLTSVTIPNSVTSIGSSAFYQCSRLTSVTIPNSVTSIGSYAFSGCRSLTSVTIGSSVTSIGSYAFYNCSGLTKAEFASIESLCKIKFSNFSSNPLFNAKHLYINGQEVTDVVIPNSVTSINDYAFSNCSGLTSVTLGSGVTSIDSEAFYNCTGLTEAEFASIESLCKIKFSNYYSNPLYYAKHLYIDGQEVTDVVIPNSITSINAYTFRNCSSLKSVTIPESVTSIGFGAFSYCSGLTKAEFASIESLCKIEFINSESNPLYYAKHLSIDGQEVTDVVIPNSVTSINYFAFYGCTGLTSVTIPNSVTSIGDYAFRYCSGLTSVTIGSSVTSIGSGAFYNCSGLTSVTIPNSVTSIGKYAFEGCTDLTSVSIGKSVTSIGDYAFHGCMGLTNVTLNSNSIVSKTYTSSNNIGTIFGSQVKEYVLGDNITSIGDYAFHGCMGLTKVTLNSNSIVSKTYTSSNNIGTIFGSQVKEYVLGDNITSIGSEAFYNCTGLTSVTIGSGVTSICKNAFEGCTGLTSVTIPNSVTSIGDYAFRYCSGLTSVTIGSSVTSIGSGAFYNCSGLTSVTIPNSVTSIGGNAFSGCSGLTSVTIGSGVTSIGGYAFYNCSGLTSVTFGTGLLSIGNNAFRNTKPTKVIWLTNTPPSGYSSAAGIVNYVANNQYASLSNTKVYPFLSSMFEVDGVRYVPVSPSERTCDAIDCSYSNEAENIVIGKTVSFKGIDMTVRSINQYTCYQNPYIKNIDLSTNCAVSDASFYGCSGVKTIILNNLGDIGSDAFYQSTGLKSLEIGSNVKNIGSKAFAGCIALQTATIQSTGTIDDYAFNGCTALTAATLGKNITGIGDYAFKGCSSLQDIIIPNAVISLGSDAFSGCSSLGDVHIGSGVTSIGAYAFSGCKALPAIEIPGNVTSIGNYTFSGCTSLKTVIMDGQESVLALGSNGSSPLFSSCPLDSVYIDRPVTYPTSASYGYSPFYRNTSLRSIHITDKLTEISDNEFYGCTNLKNVRIGNGVAKIGKWAFSGCSSLDYFSFGSGVKEIGQEAFSDCTAMTRLISLAPTPPVCGTQALDDINKWSCTLSVPSGHTAGYQSAEQWKEFFFISDDAESTGIGDIRTDSSDQPSGEPAIYDLHGCRLHEKPAHGFYIQGGKKYFVK